MLLFKNLLFYLIVICFTVTVFFIFLVVMFFIRIFTSKRTAQKTLRFLIVCYGRIIIYGFAKLLVTVKLIDSSQGKTAKDPCVYISNHRAASDAFLMGVLPGEFIQIVNLWPFKIPILGVCAKLAGYLSVRSMSFEAFSKECQDLFSNNISIVGFPEGTRSSSSQMGQFHTTLFKVAKENQLQIVPLCILGNQDKPKRGNFIINQGNVEVHILGAIGPTEYENLNDFQLKNYVRDKMQTFINNNT
ncbi:1-acyl-sn-glycerol-3-phosphate acyltransferase [bacterium]|nr:1-acyl-sn-glycerol-3-phosphate acyltransferase [bacterium]